MWWAGGGRCACGHADCRSPAKHPIGDLAPRGVKHATTSHVVIRAWWAHAPRANPALATGEASGITVLDVDADSGGQDSLAELEHTYGPLPGTQRVRTASGEHVYFTFPGTHLKNTASKLGPGLDLRCCGGYVVTVGAVHVTGHMYQWKDGCEPWRAAIAPMPGWLLDRVAERQRPGSQCSSNDKYASAALAAEVQELLSTRPGQRNARLNLAAFRLGRFVLPGALPQSLIEDSLVDAALRMGLGEREARTTIRSGLTAGMRRSPALVAGHSR